MYYVSYYNHDDFLLRVRQKSCQVESKHSCMHKKFLQHILENFIHVI